ncbi:MAG: hypothetical protein ABSB41_04960 [Anaerolineales bacterium]|jgi:REP element-mobilizing transposase RayT
MKLKYQRDEHHIHLIAHHLVWTPKWRKAVLTRGSQPIVAN